MRDNEFYHCPVCNIPSFYRGNCSDCDENIYRIDTDVTWDRWKKRQERMVKKEEKKHKIKKRILNHFRKHGELPKFVRWATYHVSIK